MTTQTWPPGVSAKPIFGSYQEALKDFAAEFQPDIGPPSRWPRSAAAMLETTFRVFLDAAQRLDLITFYVTTCKGGALPFTLADPMTGTSYTWFWTQAPTMTDAGFKQLFSAEIRIRRFV